MRTRNFLGSSSDVSLASVGGIALVLCFALIYAFFGLQWLTFGLAAFIAYRVNELSYRTYLIEEFIAQQRNLEEMTSSLPPRPEDSEGRRQSVA